MVNSRFRGDQDMGLSLKSILEGLGSLDCPLLHTFMLWRKNVVLGDTLNLAMTEYLFDQGIRSRTSSWALGELDNEEEE